MSEIDKDIWLDLKVVVTAGPTREWIDPVRFITNPSTGQIGFEMAKLLQPHCREVVFICGPGHPDFREVKGCRNIAVDTTLAMQEAVLGEMEPATALFMSAAPLDFRPDSSAEHKIKKDAGTMQLNMVPNPDILKSVAAHCREKGLNKVFRFGFAAETRDFEEYGRKKLAAKDLLGIFVNEVYKNNVGFGPGENRYVALDYEGNRAELGPAQKPELARQILSVAGPIILKKKA